MRVTVILLGFALWAQPRICQADDLPGVSCGQDTGCFQQAVALCRPARVKVAEQVRAGSLSRQTFWIQHEVLGRNDGSCWLGTRIAGMEIFLTDAFLTEMLARGLTVSQVRRMQERMNAAQARLNDVFQLPDQRRTRVSPETFHAGLIRDMNRSVLTRIHQHKGK